MASDGVAYITTISCVTYSYGNYTVTARLNLPESTPYHATYYLKNADGTFTEITPETEIPFTYSSGLLGLEAEAQLYTKTETTSTTIIYDRPNFTFISPEHDRFDFDSPNLNYISTTDDIVTLFKFNSRLHPAVTSKTTVADLQKVADLMKTDTMLKYTSGYSVSLLCHEAIFNKIKDMGIDNIGDKCMTSLIRNADKTTMVEFITMFIKQVDKSGNFTVSLTNDGLEYLHSFIIKYMGIDMLSQLKWPEDTPENHELSELIVELIADLPLEHGPTITYAALRSFGTKPYTYYAEVSDPDGPQQWDVISRTRRYWPRIITRISEDPEYYCPMTGSEYDLGRTFKNAYDVPDRVDSVAPVAGALDWVIQLEDFDAEVATLCDNPRSFGQSMAYFLHNVNPKEITAEIKAKVNSTMRSGASIRALNKTKAVYDVANDDFKTLPAKYLALIKPLLTDPTGTSVPESTFTYVGDAFTALAEVVGPSQKAISDHFTSPVLDSKIIETLNDNEGDDFQLKFAVTLMNDLYVSPCSFIESIGDKAVKSVAEVLCSCKKVVNFTETAATCDDVPAGSFYYFHADAVRPIARLCPAGTKQPEINQTECLPCEADEICETEGVTTPDKKPPGLSTSAIAGIAVGAAVVVAALGGGAFFFIKKKSANNTNNAATQL